MFEKESLSHSLGEDVGILESAKDALQLLLDLHQDGVQGRAVSISRFLADQRGSGVYVDDDLCYLRGCGPEGPEELA